MAKPLGYAGENLATENPMPSVAVSTHVKPVPLCVDLDGTLIKTDALWESLMVLLKRNPLYLFVVPFWWMRGRAALKKEIADRVELNPASLPYTNCSSIICGRSTKKAARSCWRRHPTSNWRDG